MDSPSAAPALMQGFPPSPEAQVTLANWRTAPYCRWAFQHVRELVPSADIPNEPRSIWELPRQLMSLPLGDLAAGDTDALVVLHRGRLAYEWYGNGMDEFSPHILMSVTKSLLGLLAGVLVDCGVLDPGRPVVDIIPELAGTAYRGATVRHLLDMRAGIAFDENYLARSGPIIAYRKATNWNPLEAGEVASDLRTFFGTLTAADGAHGGRFHYVSPNTDLLGWVIERSAGRRYADLMSELIWRPLGAERSAYITVDRLGAPRTAGGMCVTARDLARVGQLVVQGGARGGTRILSEGWLEDIVSNGDPEAWRVGDFDGYFQGRTLHYRSKWYVLHGDRPLLFGLGIHGQYLFVDRASEVVIARFGSEPVPLDTGRTAAALRLAEDVRRHLG